MSEVHVNRDGKPATVKDSPLSSQQMTAMAKQYQDALLQIRKDVELRKLALDQAIEFTGRQNSEHRDVLKLAKEMHNFLTQGATEAKSEG